jgi:hypothetical protein
VKEKKRDFTITTKKKLVRFKNTFTQEREDEFLEHFPLNRKGYLA